MSSKTKSVFLDRTVSNALRLFFELLVLIHHLYQPFTLVGSRISAILGPIAVGGFMFISGYGLGVSYQRDGDDYLRKLAFKRIPTTYLTIVVVNLFYLILFYLRGNSFNNAFSFIISVLYIPLFKGYVTLSHWIYFLADLMIYYIVFLILAIVNKKYNARLKSSAKFFVFLAVILCLTLVIINLTTGSSRQMRGIFLFPLGILFAYGKDKLSRYVIKNKIKLVCTFSLIAVALFSIFAQDYFYSGTNTAQVFCTVMFEYVIGTLFVLAIMVFCWGKTLKSKFIDMASSLVLYVYVSHEFFFRTFQHLFPNLHWALIMLLTVFYSILISILIVLSRNKFYQLRRAKLKKKV